MKKLILTTIFCFAIIIVKAQGNLQFNQVKLVTTVETVPANKVWKVESAIYAGGNPFCTGNGDAAVTCGNSSMLHTGLIGHMTFLINGLPNYIYSVWLNGGAAGVSPFPVWLPAGSTLAASTNMRYLSVVEFNIIP